LILVSAGFDAHFVDPLAQMRLSTAGYYELAKTIVSLADELCGSQVVFALEGGYDLTALAWSARACIDVLLHNDFAPDPLGAATETPAPDIEELLAAIKHVHGLA
jgi:acetoin utilization deacetylase AcuC-like enzyme